MTTKISTSPSRKNDSGEKFLTYLIGIFPGVCTVLATGETKAWQEAFLIFTSFAIPIIIIAALLKKQALLERLAGTDPLTGLENRRSALYRLQSWVDTELRKITENGNGRYPRVTAVYFDVDHFKGLNDTSGHKAGDVALQAIADIAREVFHRAGTDIPVRIGGDEFIVYLLNADIGAAAKRADVLRIRIEEFFRDNAQLTISCGVASVDFKTSISPKHLEEKEGESHSDMERLKASSDLAMYESKKHIAPDGRHGNKVTIARFEEFSK